MPVSATDRFFGLSRSAAFHGRPPVQQNTSNNAELSTIIGMLSEQQHFLIALQEEVRQTNERIDTVTDELSSMKEAVQTLERTESTQSCSDNPHRRVPKELSVSQTCCL